MVEAEIDLIGPLARVLAASKTTQPRGAMKVSGATWNLRWFPTRIVGQIQACQRKPDASDCRFNHRRRGWPGKPFVYSQRVGGTEPAAGALGLAELTASNCCCCISSIV